MSLSSICLILSMCSIFFVTLFTLEGYSDDGWQGIRYREKSIIGSLSCFIICFALYLFFGSI